MHSRKFLISVASVLLISILLVNCANDKEARLVELSDFKSEYVIPRNLSIWLPPGYASDGEGFPVLYMHDGQNLFDSTKAYIGAEWGVDEWISKLMAEKKLPATIVVGIWNTKYRFREYDPAKPFYNLPDSAQSRLVEEWGGVPLSDEYLKFIVEELKPYIDSHYNTLTDREHTTIMGSSMGGLISAYALVEYPDVFGKAGCLSTHWPVSLINNDTAVSNEMVRYISQNLPAQHEFKIYFDRGSESLDSWYGEAQHLMDERLAKLGLIKGKQFESLIFEGDAHNENYWNKRLDIPLQFLLRSDR